MERRSVYVDTTGNGRFKKKYWCTTHKFVIEVQKKVEDALEIDCKMGTELWERDIRKETTNVITMIKKLK